MCVVVAHLRVAMSAVSVEAAAVGDHGSIEERE
jgi:hypothetical protein